MHQDWLLTLLYGVVEGITEFLPVSSTGHLIIVESLFQDIRSDFFNVGIQSGAVLAVILVYHRRIRELLLHALQPANTVYLLKLALSFAITVGGALAAKVLGMELPGDPAPVAWAVLGGGLLIFAAEAWLRHRPVRDHVTWPAACITGLSQIAAAVFPGTSRSAASIIGAMLMGCDREKATEFSFLLGIPTLLAAGGLSFVLHLREEGIPSTGAWLHFGLGFLVSLVVAFAAVKWLLHYLRSHNFIPFAWYRLGLGLLLLLWLARP
jgi:undecaprenyl-diphosphatase